jgi:hypothetical protein
MGIKNEACQGVGGWLFADLKIGDFIFTWVYF